MLLAFAVTVYDAVSCYDWHLDRYGWWAYPVALAVMIVSVPYAIYQRAIK